MSPSRTVNSGTHSAPTRVFLDTVILGYSTETKVDQYVDVGPATIKSRGKPDRNITLAKHCNQPRRSHDTDAIDIPLLRNVATLAKKYPVEFCYSHEVVLETLFQPLVPRRFFGVPCTLVPSAVDYRSGVERFPNEKMIENECVVLGGPPPVASRYQEMIRARPQLATELVREFLLRLPDRGLVLHYGFRQFFNMVRTSHKVPANAAGFLLPLLKHVGAARYLELLSLLRVSELPPTKQPNCYLDAFLLWTAELAGCRNFLTTDKRVLENHTHERLAAIDPSALLACY